MASIRSIELAEQADTLDEQGKFEQAAEVRHLSTFGADEQEESSPVRSAGGGGKILADIEEQAIEYLWPGYFPGGRVTMVYGERGSRKSTFMSDIAARVSSGRDMPNGDTGIHGGVVIVAAEEDTAETLAPRLRQFGADMSRISVLTEVERQAESYGDIIESPFQLPDDIGILRKEIKRVHAVLVILDTLHAVVSGKISLYRNQSAREKVMVPLQALARSTGCAIVIVGHFTKGNKKNLLDAAGGSGGIVDFARVCHAVLVDQANPERSLLVNIKNNLGPIMPQMAFRRLLNGPLEYVHGELPSVQQLQQAQKLSQARQDILALLTSESPRALNSAEISQRLDLENPNVRYHLSGMYKEGLIASPARGMYTIHSQPSQVSQPSQADEKTQVIASTNGHVDPDALTEVLAQSAQPAA